MRRIRILVTLYLVVFAGATVFAGGSAEAPAAGAQAPQFPRFVEIGTAGTGGAYYPIGIAMAEIVSSELPTQATAQVTGGAVENIQLIQEQSVKIALTNAASAYRGRNGIAPFSRSDRVMGLFGNLTQGVYHIVVLDSSPIQTLNDLRGRRVSLGPAGGLGVELSGYVFAAAGFGIDDVRATYLSYDESVQMIADGNLDAVVIQTALPNPAVRSIEATGRRIRVIPLPEEVITAVNAEYPYFSRFSIDRSVYNTPTDVATLNGTNVAVVDRDMPEDVVYQITKVFMNNIDRIRASHPAASAFSLELASEMPIPLHPGAERFYREAGVLR